MGSIYDIAGLLKDSILYGFYLLGCMGFIEGLNIVWVLSGVLISHGFYFGSSNCMGFIRGFPDNTTFREKCATTG